MADMRFGGRAKRKHGDVIADVGELPKAKAMETVVPVDSIEELLKVADALLKPVLHRTEVDKHTYCIIDGQTRYCYIKDGRHPRDDSSSGTQ